MEGSEDLNSEESGMVYIVTGRTKNPKGGFTYLLGKISKHVAEELNNLDIKMDEALKKDNMPEYLSHVEKQSELRSSHVILIGTFRSTQSYKTNAIVHIPKSEITPFKKKLKN